MVHTMQSQHQIIVAADLPPTIGIATTDPSHPRNLLYAVSSLRNQATADTKYDPIRPTSTPLTDGLSLVAAESFEGCVACSVSHSSAAVLSISALVVASGIIAVVVGCVTLRRR